MSYAIYTTIYSDSNYIIYPYHPLYVDDAEYLCFTNSRQVRSSFYKIIYNPDLNDKYIEEYITSYSRSIYIPHNCIITSSALSNSSDCYMELPEYESYMTDSNFTPRADSSGNYIYKQNPVYTDGPYDGRRLLLTIGVPVSNQISTIDRCLSHIKPILDNVADSELLVIDTGSTDGTLDICKQYGARIVTFPWCNDMSAARNTGIYNALGLWYMSIDDDEWFDSVDKFITFFNSGAYSKYKSAGYIQRNYKYIHGTEYNDHITTRMAKITPKLHFEGRIHDALCVEDSTEAESVFLKCAANHYGFAIDNHNAMMDKFRRNTSILVYDLIEFPLDLRYNLQFAREFNIVGDNNTFIKYCLRGISLSYEKDDIPARQVHISHLALGLYNINSDKILLLSDVLLHKYEYSTLEKGYFAYMCICASFNKKMYIDVLDYSSLFETYKQSYLTDSFSAVNGSVLSINIFDSDSDMARYHAILSITNMQLGHSQDAYSELMSLDYRYLIEYKNEICNIILSLSTDIMINILSRLTANMIPSLYEEFQLNHKNSCELATLICKHIDKNTPEYYLFQIDSNPTEPNNYINALTCSASSDERAAYIINNALNNQIDISPLLVAIPLDTLQSISSRLSISSVQAYIDSLNADSYPIQILYLNAYLSEQTYINTGNNADDSTYLKVFDNYIYSLLTYAGSLYNSSVFTLEGPAIVDSRITAAYRYSYALECYNSNDIINYLKYLKSSLKMCPAFKRGISIRLAELTNR